ncbi:hypothetical protein WR25_07222 [Diploscapter pachys]|uniref:Paraoxonase n=1 Tax=Diploscapter pachys TaxID=2018661 RepID=A0A2A2J224_9BILA|nr:hypothetical protein WR25_07222 [Diploscapter pachys]
MAVKNLRLTLDVNKTVYNHRPGPCKQIEGTQHGSEDLELVEEESIVFVTSGLCYFLERPADVKGQILLVDLKKEPVKAVPLKIKGITEPRDFHPHGISHWRLSNGKIRLFIVSHSCRETFRHAILLFDYDAAQSTLTLVRNITSNKFTRPNDLIAVGDEQFVFTNDGYFSTELGNKFEFLLGLKWGSIMYFDGKDAHVLSPTGNGPNGITATKDKKYLIVAYWSEEVIRAFKLAKDFKSITEVSTVPLLTGVDNLYIDSKNNVWTGAHPVLHIALDAFGDANNPGRSPSQVLCISFNKDFTSWKVSEPFADDGQLMSASAAAIEHNGHLLIGSVIQELVHCKINDKGIYQF